MQTLYFDHINHNLYATVTFTQEKKHVIVMIIKRLL